jgi:F0F1-type ATP synthase membrane subunit b/b'
VSPSLTTFLFEAANFITLAALLAWLFFKPVRKVIEDQRAKAKTQEDEAAQKLSEAERGRQEIELQHKSLAAELEHMHAEARETAKQESDTLLAATRAQLERERAALKRDGLHIEKAQTAKLAHALASVAHATLKRFFEQMEGPELEQLLLTAACRELTTISNHAVGPVTIESAAPLDIEAKRLIESAMGAPQKTSDFRVVPELVAGVRISTRHGVIDASVAGLAHFAEQTLTEEITAIMREESDHD